MEKDNERLKGQEPVGFYVGEHRDGADLIRLVIDIPIDTPLYTAPPDLAAKVAELESELERERMRLAACGTAALGYFEGCCDEYKSASLDDVLRLRAEVNKLNKQNMDKSDVPYPGMAEAFESYYSQSFTNKAWRRESGVWAAAWKSAIRTGIPGITENVAELQERICDLTACKWPDAYNVVCVTIDGHKHATSRPIKNRISELTEQVKVAQSDFATIMAVSEESSEAFMFAKAAYDNLAKLQGAE